jgi:hypothetical protein
MGFTLAEEMLALMTHDPPLHLRRQRPLATSRTIVSADSSARRAGPHCHLPLYSLGTICWRDAEGEESRQVVHAAPLAAGGAQWKRREREAPQAKLAPRVVDLAPMMRSGS